MATLQEIIDQARLSLNDDDKVRWPDDECLRYAKDAYMAIYQRRPDLYVGLFATFDPEAYTLATTDPLPLHRRQVADYIIMRCETKDDESAVNNRAKLVNDFFEARL